MPKGRKDEKRSGLMAVAIALALTCGLFWLPSGAAALDASDLVSRQPALSAEPVVDAVDATASVAETSDDAATSYDLYWYALVPGADIDATGGNADERWFGLGVSAISGVEDPTGLAAGTDVTSYGHISQTATTKALFPDITYGGVTYKYAAAGTENAGKAGYYTLQPARVRVASGANAGYNSYNPTASANTYHYDNVIVLNEKDILTVNFSLKDAGETSFSVLTNYAQRLTSGSSESKVRQPGSSDVPVTKVDKSGVAYVFDGWYLDEACTQKADFKGTVTKNTVYYGRYVSQLGALSVSKSVLGSAANVNQHFTFELICASLAGKKYDVDLNADAGDGQGTDGAAHPNRVTFDANGVVTLQLRHGETVTVRDLPAGVTVSVRETGLSGNAKTSTTVVADGAETTVKSEGSSATSTDPVEAKIFAGQTQVLDFTNSAMAQPDTGLSVDPAPMLVLLAACGVGGAALSLSSKRNRDEQKRR